MKDLMPNVKIFMFVTDPVDRMFSNIKESFKEFTCQQTIRTKDQYHGLDQLWTIGLDIPDKADESTNLSSIVFVVDMISAKDKL